MIHEDDWGAMAGLGMVFSIGIPVVWGASFVIFGNNSCWVTCQGDVRAALFVMFWWGASIMAWIAGRMGVSQ